MKIRSIKHLRSKMAKTAPLRRDPKLRSFLPKTSDLSAKSLFALIRRFRMVYIKPDQGRFGIGIMRIEQVNARDYVVYRNGSLHRFRSFQDMWAFVKKRVKTRKYLVQRGIHLLKDRGRAVDFRIMVQKNFKSRWEVSGIIARRAAKNRVVTNFHNGGKPLDAKAVLQRMAGRRMRHMLSKSRILGLRSAKAMSRVYPAVNQIGLDVGWDHTCKPWILEVNTSPDPIIFSALKDKRMFRKVYIYTAHNGRLTKEIRRAYRKVFRISLQ